MEISASYTFPAPPDAVWALLMDTTAIAACLPGCRELKPIGEDRYQADLSVAVAAISGSYSATIAIEDKMAPRSYRLVAEGNGRPGFVRGQASVELSGERETTVNVAARADVGGPVARVGQRLLEGVARMTMDKFFGCLRQRVAPG